MIRIANGQGFWGDWLEAPVRLVEQGPIDYLILDYLAEITMSILQKQKQDNPELGYARDFPPLIGRISKALRDRGVKVIANAGGVNPVACAREVRRLAPSLKVAVVHGDDVLGRIDDFLNRGIEMRSLDTGEPLSTKAMIERMAAKGYWSSPGGQTPAATLYSAILREIQKKGAESRFVKADKGLFARSGGTPAPKPAKASKPPKKAAKAAKEAAAKAE